jgi:hypothetical protein
MQEMANVLERLPKLSAYGIRGCRGGSRES